MEVRDMRVQTRVHGPVSGLAEAGQLGWFAAGATVAFLIPFVFSSVLDLNNDVYYAIYFAGVAAFLTLYVRSTGLDVLELFTRHWPWSLALGVIAAAAVTLAVLNREDSTPRPDGAYFLFTIAWRGVLYGAVDALLLSAFPVAVAYALVGRDVGSVARKARFGGLAVVLVVIITATYHLGYEQFRDDGVAGPETGNLIISVPAIASTNPLGSVIAHASMHVAADTHAYETDVYLPPQTDADAD
jgi:hypothetical protein